MITIQQLAEYRLGREAKTGDDFYDAGFEILGGCQSCGASIAAYNAYPSKSGYWKCADCIGDDGWTSVEVACLAIFGEVMT